ncbi:MAG: glycosyltransferase family 2 protein [Microbacterium sp.]|nr:glycosyltransferase family 2 protein [Microbacterium sp.]MBA4346840.1 glycosyltransferase family 2 protein [Microbacterium sp.]
MCTHNGAAFVGEQVRSILSQRPAPRELVVGDDASTDDTVAEVERAVSEARAAEPGLQTQLTVLRRSQPLGVTANFDATIAACTGELVALSDQDDVWPAGRLSRLITVFDDPAVLLAHSDARLVDAHGEALGATLLQVLEVSAVERAGLRAGDAWPILLRRNTVTGATVVIRRSLAERAHPFPAAWVHDEWLAIVAAAYSGVRLIDEPLVDYRQHGGNVIGATRVTWARRWERLREPRDARAARLVARAAALVERLPEWGAPDDMMTDAQLKLAFERSRAAAPGWQPARVPGIVARLLRGEYQRFARGTIDVLRDLVQPPRER